MPPILSQEIPWNEEFELFHMEDHQSSVVDAGRRARICVPWMETQGMQQEVAMVANPARVAPRASWRQDGRVVRATNPVADILLVENDSDDVLFAQEALAETKRALKLHVVRDGADAWDLLHPNGQTAEAVRPDLILSDLHMPRMDGLELLSAIKSDVKLRPIPVILMTGSYDEVDVAKALGIGANAYIVKPMSFTELCRVMQATLSFWFDVAVAPPKD